MTEPISHQVASIAGINEGENASNYEKARLCLFTHEEDPERYLLLLAASQTFALLAVCDQLDFDFDGRGSLKVRQA